MGCRQGKPDGVALLAAGLDTDLAVHHANQLAGDDQRQFAVGVGLVEEAGDLEVAVEQAVTGFLWHVLAGVLHGKAQLRGVVAFLQANHQQYFARVGLMQGVGEQVHQHLPQAGRIALQGTGYLRVYKADQLDTLRLGAYAIDVQTVVDQCMQVELYALQRQLA